MWPAGVAFLYNQKRDISTRGLLTPNISPAFCGSSPSQSHPWNDVPSQLIGVPSEDVLEVILILIQSFSGQSAKDVRNMLEGNSPAKVEHISEVFGKKERARPTSHLSLQRLERI